MSRRLLNQGSISRYVIATVCITIAVVATLYGVFFVIPAAVTGKVPEWQWWRMTTTTLTQAESIAIAATYPATAQVDFAVGNIYGGAAWSVTGNLAIYIEDKYNTAKETIDLGATALGTSVSQYTTGDKYVIKIYNDALSEVMWTSWTVPGRSSEMATKIYGPLRMFTKPTYSLSVTSQAGTSFANAATWNITTGAVPGYATGTFDVQIYNTADNTGFIASRDPVYATDYNLVVLIKISNTNWDYVTLSGAYDYAGTKGSASYYVATLSPEDICRTKTGNVVVGGHATIPLTIEVQASPGDAIDVDITVYQFASVDYFQDHGYSFGSFAYTSSMTMQLNIYD